MRCSREIRIGQNMKLTLNLYKSKGLLMNIIQELTPDLNIILAEGSACRAEGERWIQEHEFMDGSAPTSRSETAIVFALSSLGQRHDRSDADWFLHCGHIYLSGNTYRWILEHCHIWIHGSGTFTHCWCWTMYFSVWKIGMLTYVNT